MGQYHMPVNLDKKEFLHPHKLGDGLKLWEQAGSSQGTAAAVLILLSASNGRGGGDFKEHPVIGRWVGDRVAWIGDYAEPEDLPGAFDAEAVAQAVHTDKPAAGWKDISMLVAKVLEREYGFKFAGKGWRHRHENGQCAFLGDRCDILAAKARKAEQAKPPERRILA